CLGGVEARAGGFDFALGGEQFGAGRGRDDAGAKRGDEVRVRAFGGGQVAPAGGEVGRGAAQRGRGGALELLVARGREQFGLQSGEQGSLDGGSRYAQRARAHGVAAFLVLAASVAARIH